MSPVRAVSTDSDDFVALVKRLRELGAVRVRSGAHEVAFGSEPREPEAAPPKPMAPLSKSERAELEELRRERERAEELG